jgi:hypothetical protein
MVSPESIHDLIALRTHISEDDPAAAKRVARSTSSIVLSIFFRRIRSLAIPAAFPQRGS